jgi:hypothetical protein
VNRNFRFTKPAGGGSAGAYSQWVGISIPLALQTE